MQIATAIREARADAFSEAAQCAREHGDFCDSEARKGGSKDLFERAKGAWHIAQNMDERRAAAIEARVASDRLEQTGE